MTRRLKANMRVLERVNQLSLFSLLVIHFRPLALLRVPTE